MQEGRQQQALSSGFGKGFGPLSPHPRAAKGSAGARSQRCCCPHEHPALLPLGTMEGTGGLRAPGPLAEPVDNGFCSCLLSWKGTHGPISTASSLALSRLTGTAGAPQSITARR